MREIEQNDPVPQVLNKISINIFPTQENQYSASQGIKKLNFQTPKYQVNRMMFMHDSKFSPSV